VLLVLGILGGIGADGEALDMRQATAQQPFGADIERSVVAGGRAQMALCEAAIVAGGRGRGCALDAALSPHAASFHRHDDRIRRQRLKSIKGTSIFRCFRSNGLAGFARSASATFS